MAYKSTGKYTDKILYFITNPMQQHFRIFVGLMFVLIIESLLYRSIYSATWYNAIGWTLLRIPVFIVYSYIAVFLINYLKHTKYIVLTALAIPVLIESYLLVFFKTSISTLILEILLDTNTKESIGFIMAYCTNSKFIIFVLITILIIILGLVATRCLILIKWPTFVKITTFSCLCGSVMLFALDWGGESTPYRRIFSSLKSHLNKNNDIEILANTINSISIDSGSFRSRNIVLIIGESFNKHHSELYGYRLHTNPRLKARVASENLYIYTDVVAPYNATLKVLNSILSMCSVENINKWAYYPPVQSIFYASNYYVSFISNQITAFATDNCDGGQGYFFQYKNIKNKSISYWNDKRSKYDIGLLSFYNNSIDKHQNKLTIFHLIGQHIYAKYNFPKEFTTFNANDYLNNKYATTESERQEIADYDNATLYNDYVVDSIIERFENENAIVIYLSDHGEEVYDYRKQLGRTHEPSISKEAAKYQYEIPFMIWMSDKFIKSHQDIANEVKLSVKNPYMSDDLPHTLLDIAGISCKWFDPSRSIINCKFDANRHRLLYESQDYDILINNKKL